jgi:hypothetical protein
MSRALTVYRPGFRPSSRNSPFAPVTVFRRAFVAVSTALTCAFSIGAPSSPRTTPSNVIVTCAAPRDGSAPALARSAMMADSALRMVGLR